MFITKISATSSRPQLVKVHVFMLVAIHASALRHTRTSSPIFLVTVFKSSTGSKQFCVRSLVCTRRSRTLIYELPTQTNSPFDTGTDPIERTRTRGVLRVISTLNPLRLDPANFLDISHSVCTNVAFLSHLSLQNSENFTLPRFDLIFRHERRDGLLKDVRFPMDTRGFLYYHSPAKFPATAGEIRFHITENNRPSSFFRGKDLLSHRGVPWRIPLLTIASDSLACYKPIREQLLLENLVTEEQLVTCARIFSSNSFQTNSIIVHSLDQLFPITFGSSVTLWAVAQGAAWHVRIQKLFHDMRLRPSQSPYAGQLIIQVVSFVYVPN